MKKAMKFPLAIQFFAEAGDGGNSGTDPASTGGSAPAIDYEKLADIVGKRSQQASDNALKGYLKEIGLSGEDLNSAVKDFKAKQEAEAKQKASIANTLQTENDSLKNQLFTERLNSAIMIQAGGLNIASNKVPYLQKLVDTSNVSDENGKIDSTKVKEAIEAVLKDFPELKGTTETNSGFHQIGGSSGSGNGGSLDDALDKAFGIKKK